MDRLASSLLEFFSVGAGEQTVSRPAWQRHFEARGVHGTFVLLEPGAQRRTILDPGRARQRMQPAATFDIANALIGLEVGSIADEREVFRWDGAPRPVAAWERDHTLVSGIGASVAWMFQEVARRTGRARMREGLERLRYGNCDTSGGIDHFWLQGGLRISALEQVDFLYALAEGRLAMTQRAQRLVRGALVASRTRDHTLYAKGGTSGGRDAVAWWVGWVERKGRVVACFAMNYAPRPGGTPDDRVAIGRAILAEAGVLA